MLMKKNNIVLSCHFMKLPLSRIVPYVLGLAFFLGAVIFLGCNPMGERDRASSIICAQVNGKKISLEDFNQELQRLNLDAEAPYMESEDHIKSLRKELLLLMIDKELLIQEAKAKGIKVSHQDLEVSVRELGRGYPPGKFKAESYLSDPSNENWRSFVLEGLLIKKLIQQEIEASLSITDEEIRSFFLTHKQEFDRDREFRARQIVVESEMEAREILKLLQKGQDFAQLAKERSLSPDREAGGDLGFFSLGQMPPEFDEVVSQLKKNEISDVIPSDYGYHIFQLMEIREPKEATWEEAKSKIQQILLAKKKDAAFQDWLYKLRSSARIKVNLKSLSKEY
jgi:parvulin-like peptidyl-prolyl isomerase